jgi:precorrin-2 dehydrogenase/sirohydrochlorin ferrochelatase
MTDSSEKPRKSSTPSVTKEYYPVFLDLAGKRCFVVGGGRVAERKCAPLVKAGAKVTVISPDLSPGLEGFKKKGLLTHICRHYRTGDIRPAFLVIVATGSDDINRKVVSDAKAHRVLLNVVDSPSLCNFIVPSVLRQGLLTIAVSTGGVSPAMARTVRKRVGRLYGNDLSQYLKFLRSIRLRVMNEMWDKRKRGLLLKSLASDAMMDILMQKGFTAAKKAAIGRLRNEGMVL